MSHPRWCGSLSLFCLAGGTIRLESSVKIDEVDGADRLEAFRAEGENFKGPSFDTISGSGPNGAIIHYKPENRRLHS